MVARRRLKRPPRRAAHLATHRARVSLAQAAGVDRVAAKVDQDVATMRDQIEREDSDRGGMHSRDDDHDHDGVDADEDPDTEVETESTSTLGRKVAGS